MRGVRRFVFSRSTIQRDNQLLIDVKQIIRLYEKDLRRSFNSLEISINFKIRIEQLFCKPNLIRLEFFSKIITLHMESNPLGRLRFLV